MNGLRRLGLALRKRLPDRARHVARLGRHLFRRSGRASAWPPPALLAGCRVCASRYDLVGLLPRGGRIAEIGTDKGQFARHMLDRGEPARLHLVDLDFSALDPSIAADPRVEMHDGASHEVLAQFPDAYFDWIYLDADHSYAAVSRDAAAAARKIRPGGYLVFNDFAHMDPFLGAYGVHRAAVDFAMAQGWSFVWLAYDPCALYDVALRRPLGAEEGVLAAPA